MIAVLLSIPARADCNFSVRRPRKLQRKQRVAWARRVLTQRACGTSGSMSEKCQPGPLVVVTAEIRLLSKALVVFITSACV